MVLDGNGFFASDDRDCCAIRMTGARGAADDDKRRFIDFPFMATELCEFTHDFPRRNAARVDVRMTLARLRVAVWDDAANVNIKIIVDGRARPDWSARPLDRFGGGVLRTTCDAQKENVHVRALVKNSVGFNEPHCGQFFNWFAPLFGK